MANAKSYLIPIFNGEFYAHKPPLFFWLTILVSKVSNFETASRYVSAIMSLGTILLTYLLGKRYGGQKMGFTAALILMTSGLFLWLTGTGNIDTTLTFLTTLSFFCFIRYEENRKGFWILSAYIICGIGILAKGPVALLVPWLTFVGWTTYNKFMNKEKVPYFHLIWGLLLAMGIAAIWLIPACITGGEEYTKLILIKQNLGRAVDSFDHQSPWYYFFINFPGIFAPWSLIFLAALFGFRKELKDSDRQLHFYIMWFCVTFLFFSLFSGKRGQYLLISYPAFSLFVAYVISRWERVNSVSFVLKICILLVFIFGILLILFPPVFQVLTKKTNLLTDIPLSIEGWRLWVICGIGVLPIILLWVSNKKIQMKENMEACMLFAIAVLVYFGIAQVSFIPGLDSVKTLKYFSNEIKEIVPKDKSLAFYKRYSQRGWNFYLDRDVIPVVSAKQIKTINSPYDFILKERRNKGRKPIRLDEVSPMEITGNQVYKAVLVKKIGSKEYILWKLE